MTKYRAKVEMPHDNPVFQLREVYLATDVEWERRKALILQLRIMLLTMAITLAMVLWVESWAMAYDLTAPATVPDCESQEIIINGPHIGPHIIATCSQGIWRVVPDPCLATMDAAMATHWHVEP